MLCFYFSVLYGFWIFCTCEWRAASHHMIVLEVLLLTLYLHFSSPSFSLNIIVTNICVHVYACICTNKYKYNC